MMTAEDKRSARRPTRAVSRPAARDRADREYFALSRPRLNLAPRDEAGRLWAHQLQLTIADLVTHIHDTHHPVSGWLYFEEQRPAARRRTQDFWLQGAEILGYFERVLQQRRHL